MENPLRGCPYLRLSSRTRLGFGTAVNLSSGLVEPEGRPAAPFLAHLIASQQREPQTRDRRRVEPSTAAHAYETSLKPAPVNGRDRFV